MKPLITLINENRCTRWDPPTMKKYGDKVFKSLLVLLCSLQRNLSSEITQRINKIQKVRRELITRYQTKLYLLGLRGNLSFKSKDTCYNGPL